MYFSSLSFSNFYWNFLLIFCQKRRWLDKITWEMLDEPSISPNLWFMSHCENPQFLWMPLMNDSKSVEHYNLTSLLTNTFLLGINFCHKIFLPVGNSKKPNHSHFNEIRVVRKSHKTNKKLEISHFLLNS